METRKFRFLNLQVMWRFRLEAQLLTFEINAQQVTLSCPCCHDIIRLATTKYQAVILPG